MKKLLLFCMMYSLSGLAVFSQVAFIVQSLPASTPANDSLYIAGSFNGWEPGLPAYMLHKNADKKWSITLPAQANGSAIQFKFTRGSWTSVEKGSVGEEIANRNFTFGNGSTVDISIARWSDAGGGSTSTAASNVKIISTNFYMPQLNRSRRIWIYFPPGYETSGISYPVLYMHDGQNLFDVTTSFSGEWEVDETLNKMAGQGKRVPLVVGIDNGGSDRIAEYTPWQNAQYGGGDGEKYAQFIVETLKPFIDQNYRTLPDRNNTAIMGSSLGGSISHFIALRYQDIFSKAGLFSPAYWISDSIWRFTRESGKQKDMRFYQLCGTNEDSEMVGTMQRMNDSLLKIGYPQSQVQNKIVAGGQHNEKLWRENFEEAYSWLFNSYVNSIKEEKAVSSIECYPNPVTRILTFGSDKTIVFDSVMIFDMSSRQVKLFRQLKTTSINVSDLQAGTYLIKCISGDSIFEGKFIKK